MIQPSNVDIWSVKNAYNIENYVPSNVICIVFYCNSLIFHHKSTYISPLTPYLVTKKLQISLKLKLINIYMPHHADLLTLENRK